MRTNRVEVIRRPLYFWLIAVLLIGTLWATRAAAQTTKQKPDSICGRVVSEVFYSGTYGLLTTEVLYYGKSEPEIFAMKPDLQVPLFRGHWYEFFYIKDSLVRVHPRPLRCETLQYAALDNARDSAGKQATLMCARLEKIEDAASDARMFTFALGDKLLILRDGGDLCLRQGSEYIVWYRDRMAQSAAPPPKDCASLSS